MRFYQPYTYTNGEVVCLPQLETFRRNDEYFNGVADGLRPIMMCPIDRTLWNGSSVVIWDGQHYLRSDAKTLYYYIWATETGGGTVTVRLFYDGSQIAIVSSSSGTNTSSGTYSLSAKATGIYRVHATMYRTGGSGGKGGIRPPYTRYTGSRSYTTPPTIADSGLSSATHFNKWRDNDLYFREQVRPVPGFAGLETRMHDGSSWDLWTGWDRFNPEQYQMHYKIWLQNTDGGAKFRIFYDFGGGNQQTKDLTAAGWNEGTWTLGSPGSYSRGNYYKVLIRFTRTSQYYWQRVKIRHLFMGAPAKDAGYTVMDQFTPGQWVYGNTGGQDTRLSLFSSNDDAIKDRLIFGDTTNQRQDWACGAPRINYSNGTYLGPLAFVRRFDLLYHRTQNATLAWGDAANEQTYSLQPYDDAVGEKFKVLDLNTAGVPVGVYYRIYGGSDIEYAMEYPSFE